MKRLIKYGFLLCLFFMATAFADTTEPPNLPLNAKQRDWVFSGKVTNENGESWHYFFQLKRDNQTFHATAALVDAETNAVVLYEESKAYLEPSDNTQWQVGRAFLRFNAINNSWVFGVKTLDKKGFNFKVDMLGLSSSTSSKQQALRSGVEFLVRQTGQLNGHLQIGKGTKEQFVTAKKAWFRQMWASKPLELSHPVRAVLCEFNDGSGLYSVSLQESDALKGAIAGWRDAQGMPVAMSQFVTIKSEGKDGLWKIQIPSPKLTLTFYDLLHQLKNDHDWIIGTFKAEKPGFCAISIHDLGPEEHRV